MAVLARSPSPSWPPPARVPSVSCPRSRTKPSSDHDSRSGVGSSAYGLPLVMMGDLVPAVCQRQALRSVTLAPTVPVLKGVLGE